jgi:transposase
VARDLKHVSDRSASDLLAKPLGKLASAIVKSTEAASPATRSPIFGPQAISALEAQQKEAAMQHVAIDLGGRESQICARSAQGEILLERKVPTAQLADYLKGQEPSRVVLETCAEAFRIADIALQCEHDVRVVPATLVRSLGVGARGIKTDRRDAQVLSEVSCRIELPSVHVPTDLARQRRSMCGMREELIRARTALINCVRGWARTQLLNVRSGHPETFSKRISDAALSSPDGLPAYVARLCASVDALNEQIHRADDELLQLAEHDPVCRRLMSIPGIGPVSSMRFVAAIDDVSRFPRAHAVQAFLGLTPGESSSSKKQRRTGITKAGPPAVRRALVQAAWNLRRIQPHNPISQWASQIEQRRGKFIATVAVARKLAGIMYALWRDGSTYQPSYGKNTSASSP